MNSGIESSNQQLNKNPVVLLDKAQIALDTLPTEDQKEVMRVLNCLEEFPNRSGIRIKKFTSNYFKARASLKYIVIFKYEHGEVTIIDIVNDDRLERLYGSLKGANQ
jgi:hypothetical protein